MAGIVEFPHVVQQALRDFGDLFANEPQRQHFGEYLTGLYVAANKTVSGINREFAHTTDQSCLNRFLQEAPWDEKQLNLRRLQLLQNDPSTRYSEQGVIALDNTLIDHHGKHIIDVAWFWDHADQRHKIAHDYLFINYVCTSGKHYPLDFRRFKTRELCECAEQPFKNHTALAMELIDWVCEQNIPGTFTFDIYFTNATLLNHIHSKTSAESADSATSADSANSANSATSADSKNPANKQPRSYVGSLKFNRKLMYKGRTIKAEELASSMAPADRKQFQVGERTQWYFTCSLHIPNVNHKVRVLIIWDHREDASPRLILVTNRTYWEASRIVRVYRDRWTGTETFHRDGKQQLGLGDCQLRWSEGQTRHMYLVMLAYSLLMSQLKQGHAYEWAYQKLTTIGEACRAMMRETLRTTITWAIEHVRDKLWSTERIITHLNLGET